MPGAPHVDIDLTSFAADPYPALAAMRAEAPICFVPQLGVTLITRRDDIFTCEKNTSVFSSDQPGGLMTVLMGQNLMRKDGEAHMRERAVIAASLNPRVVRDVWQPRFDAIASDILDDIAPLGCADLVTDWAMRLSAEALKCVTGLTQAGWRNMDAWSQAMIDGIANYAGNPGIEARCRAATAMIDAAIDDMVPVAGAYPDTGMLSVMLAAGLPMDSVRANIKLAISGGQNEPRDAIAGCMFALLTHPDALAKIDAGDATWLQAFEEYVRWNAPIGMSPRRAAQAFTYVPRPWLDGAEQEPVTFEPDSRVFLMFGSANRDEMHFPDAARFDIARDTSKAIAFGAGPHFCAGAWVSRVLVPGFGVRRAVERLDGLRLAAPETVGFKGWAFRGPEAVHVEWTAR